MARAMLIALSFLALTSPAFAAGGREPPPAMADDGITVMADGDAITVSITVVHARPSEGGVAPELDRIGRYLLKAFANYKSFVRLSTHDERLAVGAGGRLMLPNGHELVFKHSGWRDGFAAVHLEVGGLVTTVSVKDGGTFFQAGRAYEGGMIVLAFEVRSSR
jgi:hypothetical protein